MMRDPDRTIGDFWRKAAGLRAILHVMASICIVATGNSLLTTTVSLHLSDPAIDPHVVQLLLTAFPIGFLAGCLSARFMVVRFGHERAFLAVALLAAFGACGYMLTQAAPVWFCLRLINGFSIATLFVVSESWINLYADQKNRGAYFSLYMLMTSLATLFAQLLVEAAGANSPHLFQIVLAVILLGLIYARFVGGPWPTLHLPLAVAVEAGSAHSGNRYGIWRLAALAPVAVVCVFQAGMTNMNVYTMTPIYAERVHLDAAVAVTLVTAFSLGGMLAQAPVGWLSDRMDRRVLLLLQGLAGTGLCAAIAWPGSYPQMLLYGLFFAYGAIALTIYPVGIAYANSQLDSRHMVSASGSLLLLYSIGNIMTPGLAAQLMELFAPQALFLLLGSGAFLVAATACFNLLRRPIGATKPCLVSGGSE
ncbi:MFS transporter (plasmid) [Rhizobium leguminosarum]|uniref:MFS transporter n=1 Tax=Rhizobium leguminosarum TaxID=384 RepID=UPI00102FB4A1|nr:MFS transporter [Rhizobium leguminosarum]TBG14268.1 MFS transporter [Rhizobium leguminosarum]TBG33395.1 MFS transporter [Rhizobium leguminosarum]